MEITVREATIADIAVIKDFQMRMAAESEGLLLDPEVLAQGIKAVFTDRQKGVYYVAGSADRVIASLMITREWSDWRNGWVWWIQSVYVDQAYRGTGVFRRMYMFLQDKAHCDPDIRGLRLYVDKGNLPAMAVYEALGMNGEHYRVFEWMKT
ncbi:MAG TPA: GNAT family N-acetyltransferase [Bacteroidales bacterium]|nr:GNAT family N-acetyltransferase [Bacteroidales bacterium]HSA44897.1 GNAT family N-acetyltransferase [Bacteroidales bacterium]